MKARFTIVIASVAIALGLGLGLGLGLSGTPDGSSSTAATTDQLASLTAACQQWLNDSPGQRGTGQWCSAMAQWMSTYMERAGVGPTMMWGSTSRFRTSCVQWMTTDPPAGTGTDPTRWCDSMVSWMDDHMDAWSGSGTWAAWMRHGPMMGLGGPTGSQAL